MLYPHPVRYKILQLIEGHVDFNSCIAATDKGGELGRTPVPDVGQQKRVKSRPVRNV